MASDCYCALCCGPLSIYSIKRGSSKQRALARRKKRVENQRKRLNGENVIDEDSQEWEDAEKEEDKHAKSSKTNDDTVMEDANAGTKEIDEASEHGIEIDGEDEMEEEWEEEDDSDAESHSDSASSNGSEQDESNGVDPEDYDARSEHLSQASEIDSNPDYNLNADTRDETSSMFSYYEKHSYDPTKVSRSDVVWVDRNRVLAINKELPGPKKVFLSGRGRCGDYVSLLLRCLLYRIVVVLIQQQFEYSIVKAGKDPRDTGSSSHSVYYVYEPEQETIAFPIHEACFKLFTRYVATKDRKKVDKDVLYEVMCQKTTEMGNSLDLVYGNIEGPEQFWESFAGEEWTVADPATKPGIEEVVKSMLPAKLFDPPSTPSLDLSHKVRQDPLAVLPYDVLHNIFGQLSLKDTLSLIKASWHTFDSTRDQSFWRLMIRVHILPFFWELDSLLKDTMFPDRFDWKGAFQWLNEITKGTFAMEGPLMSIANRRRIWEVCQQLAPLYHEKLNVEAYTEPSNAEAAAIMSTAKSFHMPVTMFPVPTETRDIESQFIRSWSEIKYRACDLETYWTESYGSLIGISVNFGSVERVFGSTGGIKGQSMRIGAGDWIKELQVTSKKIETHYTGGNVDRSQLTGRDDPRGVGESTIKGMTVSISDFIEHAQRPNACRWC
jgi:hypothetical protein